MVCFAVGAPVTVTATPKHDEQCGRRRGACQRRVHRRQRPRAAAPPPSEMPGLAKKYRTEADIDAEQGDLIGGDSRTHPETRVTCTRFPATWAETVEQVSASVLLATMDGHDRVRVDLRNPELVTPERATQVSRAIVSGGLGKWGQAQRRPGPGGGASEGALRVRMALLMDVCNGVLRRLLTEARNLPGLFDFAGSPRAALFFDTQRDRAYGESLLADDLHNSVRCKVLGDTPDEIEANDGRFAIVLCPSNMHGNASHIERVEMVHYSRWTKQNIVVVINPSLMALTRHGSLDDEPRPPSFMSDYLRAYYIDPVVYIGKNATGALLMAFPRRWEMYLLKYHGDGAFRLIGEGDARPSHEKLQCEFSWRAAQ